MYSREKAHMLLKQYVRTDSLLKHSFAVEASMREYARKTGNDEELFGVTGLLHDIDFEEYPETHPLKAKEILSMAAYPDEIIDAILAHSDHENFPRETELAKALYACDGLSSFVAAYVLVRPDKSFDNVKPSSIRKKLQDISFAKTVNRDHIIKGSEELGVPLDDHIQMVIEGMHRYEMQMKHQGYSLI